LAGIHDFKNTLKFAFEPPDDWSLTVSLLFIHCRLPHCSYQIEANIRNEQGASPSEVIIEACRRNNTELLEEVISKYPNPEAVAKLLNSAQTVLGNYAYHEAASRGNCKS
jgi:hypothetical protein